MDLKERISALNNVGVFLKNNCDKYAQNKDSILDKEIENSIKKAVIENQYFEKDNIMYALSNWGNILNTKNLNLFTNKYPINQKNHNIGIIMAGNIPLVGFHDFVCTFLCGKKAIIKQSKKDKSLSEFIFKFLNSLNEDFHNYIEICGKRLKNFDAVIATGNDFSANQFRKYFNKFPNIIRQSRHSVAIIDGNESKDDLKGLSSDIFRHYGLGCRSISKIYLPKGYNLDVLFNSFYEWKNVINNSAYYNNYLYYKTIYLMKGDKFYDNGFSILKESEKIGSPIGTIFFEYYNDKTEINSLLKIKEDKIQCIVSNEIVKNSIVFGSSQTPSIEDFADKEDTMNFLLKLS